MQEDALIKLTDKTMDKLVELESRVGKLEQGIKEILSGHDQGTRDDLKLRLDTLERKVHLHLTNTSID